MHHARCVVEILYVDLSSPIQAACQNTQTHTHTHTHPHAHTHTHMHTHTHTHTLRQLVRRSKQRARTQTSCASYINENLNWLWTESGACKRFAFALLFASCALLATLFVTLDCSFCFLCSSCGSFCYSWLLLGCSWPLFKNNYFVWKCAPRPSESTQTRDRGA